MICIAIAQQSRRFALADMVNAAGQCDLLEIRLDRFEKAPDLGELLAAKTRPVIMSCRRRRDGGDWTGTEEERLAILRQCIISKADYVEIELDVADQVRKFPPAKRVITYTNLMECPADLPEIYTQAQTNAPDVIKLITKAETPEQAWPLLQILAKPAVPTVVVGLGRAGLLLTVLGKRIGAPWTYAALEKGMEAYPEQPTARDLRQIYHYDAIGRSTRFVGVTGGEDRDVAVVAGLNAAFTHLGLPLRCLPLAVGNARLFRKVLDVVKVAAVVAGEGDRERLREVATELEAEAQEAGAVDLLLHHAGIWRGCSLHAQTAITALQDALRGRFPSENPLQGRMVIVVGVTPMARALASGIQQHGGSAIIASRKREAAHQIAVLVGCRHTLFEAMYSTTHDVLIVCDEEKDSPVKGGTSPVGVHAGYLKPGMTVMDLTSPLNSSSLLREANRRGCTTVSPRVLFLSQLRRMAEHITGQQMTTGPMEEALGSVLPEEDEAG
jgi:3-dehydroquinate dehydratase/shikimate dehydrogenase